MHSAAFGKTTGGKTVLGKTAAAAALAFALGASVAACAPAPSTVPAAAGSTQAGPTADRTTVEAVALAASANPADAAKPKPVKTFTFPDGHISFQHPAGWSVRTAECPTIPGGPAECVEANIMSKGKPIAVMVSGFYGDGAAGPVDRTVLDSALVPGLAVSEDDPTFAFFKDSYGDVNDHYFMTIGKASEAVSGSISGGMPQVLLPNGVGVFRVYIDSGKLANDAEARAWMATAEYAQFKSMLMSVSYK
ncbi:hypothetical protein [Arthrobacter celericrescens]|uniref:hypothetical protein n=1 Tax=Arthrobacter celericrescens TaxID=2320851 RepID=UPI000EA3A4DE|nr:hypothetical protein [Arthrobacter celericrescens]